MATNENNYQETAIYGRDSKFSSLLAKVRGNTREMELPFVLGANCAKEIEAHHLLNAAMASSKALPEPELGFRDSVSGLVSASAFDARLSFEVARAKRYKNPLTVCLINIDGLAEKFAQFGQEGFNSVVATVGDRLIQCIREVDLAAKLNSEDFGLIFPETPAAVAAIAAERIRVQAFGQAFSAGGSIIKLTVSIGLSSFVPGSKSYADVYDAARRALAQAEASGGGQIRQAQAG